AEGEGMDTGAGALADDEVDAKIFHGGVEDFFDGGLETMDFVEEEDFLRFKGSEDGGEVALAFEEGAGAGLDGDGKLVGDDLRERGLAEAGGAVEEHVVESFVAAAGGFDGDLDIYFNALLADVFVEALGANAGFDAPIFVDGLAGDNTGGLTLGHHPLCAGVRHARVLPQRDRGRREENRSAHAPARVVRPLGALRDCREARRSFSKLAVPASCLASATALSAVRAS